MLLVRERVKRGLSCFRCLALVRREAAIVGIRKMILGIWVPLSKAGRAGNGPLSRRRRRVAVQRPPSPQRPIHWPVNTVARVYAYYVTTLTVNIYRRVPHSGCGAGAIVRVGTESRPKEVKAAVESDVEEKVEEEEVEG